MNNFNNPWDVGGKHYKENAFENSISDLVQENVKILPHFDINSFLGK